MLIVKKKGRKKFRLRKKRKGLIKARSLQVRGKLIYKNC